ncbi:MAG: hypothetical protein FWF24_01935 [Alphaproteobacteria bacterium]|nr:hypothetical protein [Alphaproteobacteria bacterium]
MDKAFKNAAKMVCKAAYPLMAAAMLTLPACAPSIKGDIPGANVVYNQPTTSAHEIGPYDVEVSRKAIDSDLLKVRVRNTENGDDWLMSSDNRPGHEMIRVQETKPINDFLCDVDVTFRDGQAPKILVTYAGSGQIAKNETFMLTKQYQNGRYYGDLRNLYEKGSLALDFAVQTQGPAVNKTSTFMDAGNGMLSKMIERPSADFSMRVDYRDEGIKNYPFYHIKLSSNASGCLTFMNFKAGKVMRPGQRLVLSDTVSRLITNAASKSNASLYQMDSQIVTDYYKTATVLTLLHMHSATNEHDTKSPLQLGAFYFMGVPAVIADSINPNERPGWGGGYTLGQMTTSELVEVYEQRMKDAASHLRTHGLDKPLPAPKAPCPKPQALSR